MFVGALDQRHCAPNNKIYELPPKLIINLYLRGCQRFVIDGTRFVGAAHADGRPQPRVLMINVKRPAQLYFDNDSTGAELRKVYTSASLRWLEHELGGGKGRPAALEQFFANHLSQFAFEPSQELIELGEQICRPPAHLSGEMLDLYRKSRGLDILRLSYTALVADAEGAARRPALSNVRQSERVKEYILANLAGDLSIEKIARACGASVSSVQRHFKHTFDTTVSDFIRRKRLEAARDALVTRGVSVAESAWIAGYESRPAFTAAFKKAFGTSPGDVRA